MSLMSRQQFCCRCGELKALVEFLLEHPCVDCGETDMLVLQFDHRDRTDKVIEVGRLISRYSGWPQIAGRIVSSTVEHYRQRVGGARTGNLVTFYEAVVEYAYSVNDREFHSTRLNFGARVAGSQQLAEAQASRYPEGSQVMVHYDPKNPANSVVETEVAHGVMMIVVALGFFAAAIFFSGVF